MGKISHHGINIVKKWGSANGRMGELLIQTSENRTREIRGGDRKSKLTEVTLIPALSELGITKRMTNGRD
jgi:hypothetical protein